MYLLKKPPLFLLKNQTIINKNKSEAFEDGTFIVAITLENDTEKYYQLDFIEKIDTTTRMVTTIDICGGNNAKIKIL